MNTQQNEVFNNENNGAVDFNKKVKEKQQALEITDFSSDLTEMIIKRCGITKEFHTKLYTNIYNSSIIDKLNLNSVLPGRYAKQLAKLLKDQLSIRQKHIYLKNEYGIKESICKAEDFPWLSLIGDISDEVVTVSQANSIALRLKQDLLDLDETPNTIVQFNDYYIENAIIKKGVYTGYPQFYIPRNISYVVENKTYTKVVPEVDKIINHLSNYDEESSKYLKYLLSTMFMNHASVKKKYDSKIIYFYGEGNNGKSTLVDLIQDTLNNPHSNSINNITSISFTAESLNENGSLCTIAKSLFAVDTELDVAGAKQSVTSKLKAMSSGDAMLLRPLYMSAHYHKPTTLFLLSSNEVIKSADKSFGWLRRQEWIKVNEQLGKQEEGFFDRLRSEESRQYMLELLILHFMELMEMDRMPARPKLIAEANEDYEMYNNSALDFITNHFESIDDLHAVPVRYIKDEYLAYCELNDLTHLKKQDAIPSAIKKLYPSIDVKTIRFSSLKGEHFQIRNERRYSIYTQYQDKAAKCYYNKLDNSRLADTFDAGEGINDVIVDDYVFNNKQ